MAELVLWSGWQGVEASTLLGGLRAAGFVVVRPVEWNGGLRGRFDGVAGACLDKPAAREFLVGVEATRPEWFVLVNSPAVAMPGYGVQSVEVAGGVSVQFGHRSGWTIDLADPATLNEAAMAIVERSPAATKETAARSARRGKVVTIAPGVDGGFSGGKGGGGVWQTIVNEMPSHDVYVEGCLGRGAVMRHKRPAEASVGIESDGDVIREHWQGTDVVPGLRIVHGNVRSWVREAFGLGVLPGVSCCLCCGARWDVDLVATRERAAVDRQCRECGRTVLCYFDPPYLMATRRSGRTLYRDEWTPADHAEFLRLLKRLPCYVLVSGYASDLYRSLLKGWRLVTFEAMTRGGTKATEHLWLNYSPAETLHDPRWLGVDRRAREKWRRRADSMVGKLLSLSPLERQAVLDRMSAGGVR